MSKWIRLVIALLVAISVSPVLTVKSQANTDCDLYGTHSDSAVYCITLPPPGYWNGDLVIFAHGYVPVSEPVDIPWEQMTFLDGSGGFVSMTDLINGMGFAFATTSYSENGLAVLQGIDDILDLIAVFESEVATPGHIYLVGASEGGLVTTLALERHPEAFTGGLATCGPIGDFQGQVNYWGDFRVVFDYFMDTPEMDVLPGNATTIPKALMNKWDSKYVPLIAQVLADNPLKTQQLMFVTGAPFDPLEPNTIGETVIGILWYNMRATNDAVKTLDGQPYDNRDRVYTGSFDDVALNEGVKRFKARDSAQEEIANNYETTGVLMRPLVTLHTTMDPIIPYWHQTLYEEKVLQNSGPYAPYLAMTVEGYGHCTFSVSDAMLGFVSLVSMSTGQTLQPPPLP